VTNKKAALARPGGRLVKLTLFRFAVVAGIPFVQNALALFSGVIEVQFDQA
jgi:hypothetical protein